MKKLLYSFVFAASLSPLFTSAQISHGGQPLSTHFPELFNVAEKVSLRSPDLSTIIAEDKLREKNGQFYRNGVSVFTDISPENSGSWTTLPDFYVRFTSY